jgi:methyl-accepting chemotaxis protein
MSLRKNNRYFHSASLRLTAWYASLFTGGIIMYVLVALFSMSATMNKHDRALLSKKAEGYSNVGRSDIRLLQEIMEKGEELISQDEMLVILQNNGPPFLSLIIPESWKQSALLSSGLTKITVATGQWYYLDKDGVTSSIESSFFNILLPDPARAQVYGVEIDSQHKLFVGKTQKQQYDSILSFIKVSLIILLLLIGWSFACGIFLTRKAVQPVREFKQTIENVLSGSVHSRMEIPHTGDEFEDLAKIFNNMLDRVETVIKGNE